MLLKILICSSVSPNFISLHLLLTLLLVHPSFNCPPSPFMVYVTLHDAFLEHWETPNKWLNFKYVSMT